jgi:hypothetical protein
MNTYALDDPVVFAFVVIPALLVAALAWGVVRSSRVLNEPPASRRQAIVITLGGAAIWMAATWMAARSGVLLRWDATPPPFALLVAGVVVLAVAMAFGPYGRRLARGLPLWALVAVQGFRFPLELAMHAMYERGVMPVQMSYSGRNFDIATGVTAIVVGALVWTGRGGRRLVLAWNLAGLALLLNIVTIAILSTPRFRYFGDDRLNVWVMYAPFVWLPAVMVLAALAGHLITFRALKT